MLIAVSPGGLLVQPGFGTLAIPDRCLLSRNPFWGAISGWASHTRDIIHPWAMTPSANNFGQTVAGRLLPPQTARAASRGPLMTDCGS